MIRAATCDDYAAFTRLFRELGIDDPAPTTEQWSADLVPTTLVSEQDGLVDGYVSFQAIGRIGYVRNLVVAPHARGRGLGAALMQTAASSLRARGVTAWHLNVKTENAAAKRLYEGLGMTVEQRSTALRLAWNRARDLPGEPATVMPVTAAEDHDVERSLGLVTGQIAMARRRAAHVLTQLRDDELEAVGFAAFDPAFPGARIFRVSRPSLAATLLAALRPHARHEEVVLVIDDDAPTTQLLIANGANVRLELLHYSGRLPT